MVSNHLVHRCRPGTLVQLDQAAGEFVLPAERPEKALFVTAGSGITPVMGMLRNHPSTDSDVLRPERSATSTSSSARRAERPDSSSARPAGPGRRRPDPAGRAAHRHRRHARRRRPAASCPTSPSAPPGPAARSGCSRRWRSTGRLAGSPTALHRAVPPAGPGHRRGRHRHASPSPAPRWRPTARRPILDAAEDAGVLMPSGCRMGICYGCVLPLREGACATCATASHHRRPGRRRPQSRPASAPPPAPADIDH